MSLKSTIYPLFFRVLKRAQRLVDKLNALKPMCPAGIHPPEIRKAPVTGWLWFRRTSAGKLVLAGALIAISAHAETSGGVFRGQVRDPSSAIVPKAEIVIRSNDNGTEVLAESNGDGLYVTPTVIPGSYTLSATKPGFETEVFGPVTLEVDQTMRVDFSLNLGAATESVQVEASGTQLLSTESAEVSQVIVSKQVAEMPLNGRSWQQLIDLSAGVSPGAPGESGSPNPVNINGQRTKANLYLVDGISTTSSTQGRDNDFNIPLDAVREFSVQAGSYSAEYGDVAGGVINLQSKSGTNHWHGSLFEFFRNDALDASNFFSNQTGQPKNALRYNQFGGSLGGPIRRNKTFFFADYQGTVIHTGQPMVTSVPSSAQRGGNFSGLLGTPIYNPFGTSFARTPFAGNIIPASLLNPAAVKISSLLPLPNQFDAAGNPLPFNNYAVTRVDTSNVQSFDVRVDHQFSAEKQSICARVVPEYRRLMRPPSSACLWAAASRARAPPAPAIKTRDRLHLSDQPHACSMRSASGLNRQTTALTQEDYGQNLSQQFGIPGINVSPQTSGLSNLDVAGLFDIGDSLLTPLQITTTDWNVSDKVTWVKGRHVIHVGIDYQHEMGSTGYLVYGRGLYTFLNLSTSSLIGTPGGNAFASFLVGAPYQILRDEFPPGLVGLISYRVGFFAQDDIKLTRKLTVNVGARYDIMPYPREMHNRLSNFDPATRNHADCRSKHQSAAGEHGLQRPGAARRPGLFGERQDRDSRGIRHRLHRSIWRGRRAQQQRIQRAVLLSRQHHGVSVQRAHLHAGQRTAPSSDALAERAHGQSALHRPHRRQSVFSDLELHRTTGSSVHRFDV